MLFHCLRDLDDDGMDDLAVGSENEDGAALEEGAVYLHYLTSAGASAGETKVHMAGLAAENHFGSALALVGNDLDGFTVLAVGANGHVGPVDDDHGSVWLLTLSRGGTVSDVVALSFSSPTLQAALPGIHAQDALYSPEEFGSALATIPDIDGDGLVELAVGAPEAKRHGHYQGETYWGRVWLYQGFGAALGVPLLPEPTNTPTNTRTPTSTPTPRPPVSLLMKDLEGTWSGRVGMSPGQTMLLEITIDRNGNGSFVFDGQDSGHRATFTILDAANRIATFTRNDTVTGVLQLAADLRHATYVNEFFTFGALQKPGGEHVRSYTNADVRPSSWSGAVARYDVTGLRPPDGPESPGAIFAVESASPLMNASINALGEFTYSDALDPPGTTMTDANRVAIHPAPGSALNGIFAGDFENTAGDRGDILFFMSRDREFMAVQSCFPVWPDCAIGAWSREGNPPNRVISPCVGDCRAPDGVVTVDELISCTMIAVGDAPLSSCSACDADGVNGVSIDEVLTGVAIALGDFRCEGSAAGGAQGGETGAIPAAMPTGTPTATAVSAGKASATPSPSPTAPRQMAAPGRPPGTRLGCSVPTWSRAGAASSARTRSSANAEPTTGPSTRPRSSCLARVISPTSTAS